MEENYPLKIIFFKTDTGREPVREWIKGMSSKEKKIIGEDIRTLQRGWPLGMPLVKNVDKNVWEIRTKINKNIYRIFFTLVDGIIVLVHGFVKKTQKIPRNELKLTQERLAQLRSRS